MSEDVLQVPRGLECELILQSKDCKKVLLFVGKQCSSLPSLHPKFEAYEDHAFCGVTISSIQRDDSRVLSEDPILLFRVQYNGFSQKCGEVIRKECAVLWGRSEDDYYDVKTCYRWMRLNDALSQLKRSSSPPVVCELIERLIQEDAGRSQYPQFPLHLRRNFYRDVNRWTELALEKIGWTLTSELAQVRTSWEASLLAGHSNKGKIYCKVSHPKLPEAMIHATLYELFPEEVVKLLFCDREKNLIITQDLGANVQKKLESTDGGGGDESVVENAMKEKLLAFVGRLQAKSVKHVERLRLNGWTDSDPAVLKKKYSGLISSLRSANFIGNDQLIKLQSVGQIVDLICDQIGRFGIPITFCHGDLHLMNVTSSVYSNTDFQLLDWSWGTLSHPFFDILDSLDNDNIDFDLYLRCWESYHPLQELRKLLQLMKPLYWVWKLFCFSSRLPKVDSLFYNYEVKEAVDTMVEEAISDLKKAIPVQA